MTSMNKPLFHEFDDIWLKFAGPVRGAVLSAPKPGEPSNILTSVVRIPAQLADDIMTVVSALSRRFPGHYLYPKTDLHLTVLNCTPALEDPRQPSSDEVHSIAEDFQEIVSQFRPFQLRLCGLNVFPTTVFAQVLDESHSLETLRERLRRRFDERLRWSGTHDAAQLVPSPSLSYVNVLRFDSVVEPALLDGINHLRRVDLGHFTVSSIELVTTDKLLSMPHTVSQARFVLE